MDILNINGVGVEGVAACIPDNCETNDRKVAEATGIFTRRIADEGVTGLDLCVRAAERVIADTGSSPDDFKAVVAVSFTQHDRMPCNAAQAQARLGLPKGILAFDVLQACAGYGYGLYVSGLLARETGGKVLLLDGDKQSEFLNRSDASTVPVLADGGTASVISPSAVGAGAGWQFAFMSDGAKGDVLKLSHGGAIAMDGFGVFKFVATDVVGYLKEFILKTKLDISTLNAFVPHQANVYMVRQLAAGIGVPVEKLKISADRFGNLSSASIPATLAATATTGKVLLAGFGGGLSFSAAAIDIAADCRFAVVGD